MPVFPLPSRGPLEHVKQSYLEKKQKIPEFHRISGYNPSLSGTNLTSSQTAVVCLWCFAGVFCVKKWTPGQSSGLLMQLIFGWTAFSGAADGRGGCREGTEDMNKNPTKNYGTDFWWSKSHTSLALITRGDWKNWKVFCFQRRDLHIWLWLEVASSSSTMEVVKLPATCKILRF